MTAKKYSSVDSEWKMDSLSKKNKEAAMLPLKHSKIFPWI